jgi:Zn finger protein HypA/HybF involved in hydrogenase expression
MDWFHCFDCREYTRLADPAEKKCASCGSKNGKVVSLEAVESAFGGPIKDPEKPKRPK